MSIAYLTNTSVINEFLIFNLKYNFLRVTAYVMVMFSLLYIYIYIYIILYIYTYIYIYTHLIMLMSQYSSCARGEAPHSFQLCTQKSEGA